MHLKPIEAIYLRWISEDRSVADIAKIEQQPVHEIQQKLDAISRRLGVASIHEAAGKAKSSNLI